jgi:hypothetical protein
MIYIFIFIIFAFLLSIGNIYLSKFKTKQEISQQSKLIQLINNNVIVRSKEYLNKEFTKAIVLDEQNNKIHFLSTLNNYCKTFNFDDLIESEIIIDSNSIIKSNRGNQIVSSAIGGIIAGVPGMIIGGLSSGKITSEKIKNITIKFTFNDLNNPIYKFSFLDNPNGMLKDTNEYKNIMNFVDRWYGYFTVILKQQNKIVSN